MVDGSLVIVDGRIVIVALYQTHIVGVSAEFPGFHRRVRFGRNSA